MCAEARCLGVSGCDHSGGFFLGIIAQRARYSRELEGLIIFWPFSFVFFFLDYFSVLFFRHEGLMGLYSCMGIF